MCGVGPGCRGRSCRELSEAVAIEAGEHVGAVAIFKPCTTRFFLALLRPSLLGEFYNNVLGDGLVGLVDLEPIDA
jgi:hypothetical protein